MNRILCAIDFSEPSINALEFATELANECEANLTLVHIFTEKDFNDLYQEDEDRINTSFKEKTIVVEERLKLLRDEINKSEHNDIREVGYLVEYGEFTKTINEISDDNYDLIVMGTRGFSHRQGLILGSNTLEVISKTKSTVLAVPAEATYKPFKYMVYASDLHDKDKIGLMKLIPIATCFDARINVVHFTSRPLSKVSETFNNFKAELSSFVDYPKIGYDLHNYEDQLNLSIEEYISSKNGSLLALLDKKHTFFENLFHESLIQKMSYITDTPLLVMKS